MRPTDCGRNLNISPFPPLIRFNKASWYVNHSLYHPRPIVCCSSASFCLSILQPCYLLSFLCFPISLLFTYMFYFYFSSISPFLPSLSWFYLVSFLWPPGDLYPVTFLHRWPPVLCDCPCQMLPITVRNMPSISPLILKRLKVQLSLPSPCPHLSARPVDANRRHLSPKPPQPLSALML